MDRDTIDRLLRAWVIVSLVVGLAFIFIGRPVLAGVGVTLVILGLISVMFLVGIHIGGSDAAVS